MADLVVMMTDAVPDTVPAYRLPLPDLAAASMWAETIAIGPANTAGQSAVGSLVADASHYVLMLEARADCWVAVGPDPNAVAGQCMFLPAGRAREGYISPGHKVAVVEDS